MLMHTRFEQVDPACIPPRCLGPWEIGGALAKINRFAGNTPHQWSVASHSVLVSRLCSSPEAKAWGLLHDAHEAFLGDIITPALEFIAAQSQPMGSQIVRNCVRQAKASIDRQVQNAWHCHPHEAVLREVARADHVALAAERAMFFAAVIPEDDHDDAERGFSLIRDMPADMSWQNACMQWAGEAQSLACRGLLSLPAAHCATTDY